MTPVISEYLPPPDAVYSYAVLFAMFSQMPPPYDDVALDGLWMISMLAWRIKAMM